MTNGDYCSLLVCHFSSRRHRTYIHIVLGCSLWCVQVQLFGWHRWHGATQQSSLIAACSLKAVWCVCALRTWAMLLLLLFFLYLLPRCLTIGWGYNTLLSWRDESIWQRGNKAVVVLKGLCALSGKAANYSLSCVRVGLPCKRLWSTVTLLPATSDIMSIVVDVPLSYAWPHCRGESEDLRTSQDVGFSQFRSIM